MKRVGNICGQTTTHSSTIYKNSVMTRPWTWSECHSLRGIHSHPTYRSALSIAALCLGWPKGGRTHQCQLCPDRKSEAGRVYTQMTHFSLIKFVFVISNLFCQILSVFQEHHQSLVEPRHFLKDVIIQHHTSIERNETHHGTNTHWDTSAIWKAVGCR